VPAVVGLSLEMAWTVYLARCSDGTLYTGVTTDPDRRLAEHNAGGGGAYTRSRVPVTLVYWETANDRSGALRREYAIKRLTRSQKEDLVAAYLRLARRSDPV
jgi:putative endonuclease